MNRPQLKRMTIVIAVCAVVGAIAGIAGSAAAPSSSKSAKAQKKAATKQARALKRSFRLHGPGKIGFFGGPVHATAVVPNQDGTGFDTITSDAGTLNSVDGTTVHLKEGTPKKVYKDDVAVAAGSNAKVIRNGADAKLSDLQPGDHVRVITGGARGNIVIAASDAWVAQQKKRFREHGFGHRFAPGGPPPGAPGAPGDDSGSNQNGSNSISPSTGTNS